MDIFRQYQNAKTILKNKNMGQNCFKKLWKSEKFQLSNFTLTWSNEGKINSVLLDMICQKNYNKKWEC